MQFLGMPPEAESHLEALANVGGVSEETARTRPKAGLWGWLAGAGAPDGRPHFPTHVKIAALGPAPVPVGEKGPRYQVTVEVETEEWQVDRSVAPRPPATHYVLTASVVRTPEEAEAASEPEEFRHHCKSTVPFARRASFAVTGLSPGTLYELDVCASNAMGSSEGVQVHVLTPSPSASTAPAGGEAGGASRSGSTSAEEDDDGEESFFDADEHGADARSHASNEGRKTLEELLCEEPEGYWEDCQDAAAEQAGPPLPPEPGGAGPPAAAAGAPPGPGRGAPAAAPAAAHGGSPAKAGLQAGSPTKASLFPGFVWASGFQVNERQLNSGHGPKDVEHVVERLQTTCVSPITIKPQQALRLALGMGLDVSAAEGKWRQILSWRREFRMEEERAHAREQHSNRSVPVSFPHHDEVCEKLLMVSPCALVTTNGHPVSVWHIGTLSGETAMDVPLEHVNAWSRGLFEYLDVWLSEESDRTSRLLGHIHVFDLEGLSWWHLVSGELLERGRSALHAGEFYVENCYDVYAINASSLFNTVWRLLQRFLSARAAAKIVVDSGVPNELLEALGPMAWERLQGVLQAPANKTSAPILRPPRRGGRFSLL